MIHRRKLITGLVSLVAAPAIVRASSLMPVKSLCGPSIYLDFEAGIARAEGKTYVLSAWVKHLDGWCRVTQTIPPGKPLHLSLGPQRKGLLIEPPFGFQLEEKK